MGIGVGASLAIAGALMQALTRNPLADPGLLGVNSGASLAVVFAIWVLGITSIERARLVRVRRGRHRRGGVYMLGSLGRGGATPVRLALAGAAIHALLFALIGAVLIMSQRDARHLPLLDRRLARGRATRSALIELAAVPRRRRSCSRHSPRSR